MDSLELIGQGKTAEIYSYEKGKVLKLFDTMFSDSVVKKEFMLSRYAYSQDINTPYPYKIVDYKNKKGTSKERYGDAFRGSK